ncbi:MAG TPA: hypothetical protein PKD64_12550 [Pirellulaceae bacterium]|nr:hypothetical protein [Pirellulaceae bacterium]HMO93017.1 hypothetical protein [Pirellulaceae bacterium]HMP67907.1 hypothetical protein [Pirellulaceae bacterium]
MNVGAAQRLAKSYASIRGETSLDTETIERLAEKTQCNPLAIRITIDGIVAGLDVNEALSQTKDGILDFSYKNLLQSLPPVSNRILECLFAANTQLSRSEIRILLETDSDTIATGLQSLIRTSLISRHADSSVESYSLSGSIRDLLLRNPLDEKTRESVVHRLSSQEKELARLKTQDRADPLDRDFIPPNCVPQLAQPLLTAFSMVQRNASKASMADHLDDLRGHMREHSVSELYRAATVLFYALNDRSSARQILEQARQQDILDPAARLMLAEHYKDDEMYNECKEVAMPLLKDGWFSADRTDRTNLARLARVTWLVEIWLGEENSVATRTRDWSIDPVSRAIKGSIYVTAIRRLLRNENSVQRASGYISELTGCLDSIFNSDGYVGFVVAEAVNAIASISDKLTVINPEKSSIEKLATFIDQHLVPICNIHNRISLGDENIVQFVERVQDLASQAKVSQPKAVTLRQAEDPALAQYGYIPVRVYARPCDSFGNFRAFLFAKDDDGNEYHVSSRAMVDRVAFANLREGDLLLVLPREDYDEDKARPVRDALPQ